MKARGQEQPIPFMKLSGSGNDFILIDNRDRLIDPKRAGALFRQKSVRIVCRLEAMGSFSSSDPVARTFGGVCSMRTAVKPSSAATALAVRRALPISNVSRRSRCDLRP